MRIFLAPAILVVATPAIASEAAYRELLAADRAWSARAASANLPDGLAAMFDDKAIMISGGLPDFAHGPAAIRARLAARPENLTSKVSWSPVGGGVSADGTHGYSYGGLTVRPASGAAIEQKYLAYWVKGPAGWRVLAYKRAGRREAGPLKAAPPVIGQGRHTDAAGATMAASEKAFSDEAQRIGLRAAFTKWGRPDSMNLGADDAIAIGSAAIGNGVAGPEPTSPVTWAADEHVVAGSGDMGLTWGMLHFAKAPEGAPPRVPFFTVWARPKPGDAWRYVAE